MKAMTTLARTTLALVLVGTTVACDSGPMEPEIDEPPAPTFETLTDVTLTPRYLTVRSNGACDGEAVISGKPRDGEFQYRVEGYRNGSLLESLQSSRYGSRTGATQSAGPGETIDFTNETWRFDNLRTGDQVELRFRATEWDVAEDSYLNDKRSSTYFNLPLSARSERGARLSLGASSCGLILHYDLRVTTREVRLD